MYWSTLPLLGMCNKWRGYGDELMSYGQEGQADEEEDDKLEEERQQQDGLELAICSS